MVMENSFSSVLLPFLTLNFVTFFVPGRRSCISCGKLLLTAARLSMSEIRNPQRLLIAMRFIQWICPLSSVTIRQSPTVLSSVSKYWYCDSCCKVFSLNSFTTLLISSASNRSSPCSLSRAKCSEKSRVRMACIICLRRRMLLL